MFVDFHILNELGSPSINSNTFANRPAAGQTGRLFVSTDTYEIYRDNGTTWDLIGGPGTSTITGSGTATQVAYFTSSQAIGSSANLYWDNTNGRLGIGTATPGTKIDIHGTGTIAQLNSTGTTNNGYLAFQRAGTTTFSIGDTYNAGDNYFRIFGNTLSADIVQIFAATGKTTFTSTQTISTGLARANYFEYNMSTAAGATFSTPNAISAVGASLIWTLNGSATVPTGARSGLDAYNQINFAAASTLTVTQGTKIRAYSNLTAGWNFYGAGGGTITHLAGMRVLFPDQSGGALTVTNNYGLLINDQTSNTGAITYTNRWGIYQEGASDLNYLAANLLIGSTTNSGEALQVTGTAKATNIVIAEQAAPATPSSGTGILYAKTDNLPYYKNDQGTEYNITFPESQITNAFKALGSQAIGFNISNINNNVNGSLIIADQTIYFNAYYIPIAQTITGVKWLQLVQGNYTANNYNGIGLYSYSGGTMTLVASSTNDGNIWKGTGVTWQSKSFSSSYSATAGIYFIAALYCRSAVVTGPEIGSFGTFSTGTTVYDFTNSAKLTSTIATQTALPATQLQSGTTANTRVLSFILY